MGSIGENMTSEEIDKIWPEFEKWVRKKYPWLPDKIFLIKLWYEWLEVKGIE